MKRLFLQKLFLFILATLSSSAVSSAEKINVVVSIHPLRDIVRQVGGDKVNVDFIVPAGASPHTFEPSPSDMRKISNAKMLVLIGSGFEFWAEKTVRSAGRKDLKVVILSKGVPLMHEAHPHDEDKKHHREDIADPHIWLDPLLVKDMTDRVASALIEADASHRDYFLQRAEGFKKELQALHIKIAESVKDFKIKEYVTFHSAWGYFSKRYGFKITGVIEESPGKEASPKHIARIIRAIRHSGSKVVFAEPQFNPKIAEVIAKEAGAKILLLDPIGSPDIKGRDTYTGLMGYNLSILEQAMK